MGVELRERLVGGGKSELEGGGAREGEREDVAEGGVLAICRGIQ